ncbi:MAG TPA: metallophosphoesterase family protein [Candidatus Polarisedimenticolia bacterium]|nr:metallophosphoesterase family protein [Candidatus Polarisedimenticolia bacterium]
MRTLVLSDLHSNLEAMSSVLADARRRGFDRSVVLGDIVGYGASPNEVVELVRALGPEFVVRGNHDKVACGITDGESFNDPAREAALWTREALTPDCLDYLQHLAQGPLDAGGFLISHGAPLDEEDYLLGYTDAEANFDQLGFDVALFGHTHFACLFELTGGRPRLMMLAGDEGSYTFRPGARYLVNPGSVGQPRDHNPNASYLVLDSDAARIEWHRVPYDIAEAQSKIADAGLPDVLWQRLSLGV